MQNKSFLLLFLAIILRFLPVLGQDIANLEQDNIAIEQQKDLNLDWQEQILQQIDIEMLGEAAYGELLDELSDLVVWSDTTASSLLQGRLKQNLILSSNRTLSQRAGYKEQTAGRQSMNKAYLGDPWHHSLRYRMQLGKHVQAGLNMEKDAGEAWRHQFPAFDSWHAFVRAKDVRISSNLKLQDAVVGHYRLRMGCGLLVNQGFSLGKQYLSRQLTQQRNNTITPFASNAEYAYMQGAAMDLRMGSHFSLLPYFSARQIDGTYHSDRRVLTALQTDGYHRTQTEDGHRHAAWEIVAGARLGWRGEWYDVGLHGTYTQLQYDYVRNNLYYNTNYFRGHQLAQFSADYTARALGGFLRGEFAIDDKGAIANLTALQYKLNDNWVSTLLYRYYDLKYRQIHGSALGENSEMQGEQGATLNFDGQLSAHWQLQSMLDYFWFGQPQYGIRDSRSQGLEGMLRLIDTHRKVNGSFCYRIKQKADYIRHSFDGMLNIQPNESLASRTQLRARIYNKKEDNIATNSYGYAVSQSFTWNCRIWKSCPFSLVGQACYFHTDDYNSRIYLTEKAILYGFGLPMLYGEGLRYSVTGTLKIGPHINVDLKWAMTNYANRATISSGLQEIKGNTQQDLWLQLRLKI